MKIIAKKMPPDPQPRENIRQQLEDLSRDPFKEILYRAIQGAPKARDYEKLGEKSPDRHAQALVMLAKLSGYSEKLQVDSVVSIADLSDSELDQRLRALEEAINNQIVESPKISD